MNNLIKVIFLHAIVICFLFVVFLVVRAILSTIHEMKHGGGGFKE